MKKILAVLLLLLAVAVYVFNTNRFQAFFLVKSFYADIADMPFDVTRKGERITIPIKFKYKTCYDLGIKVPGRELSDTGMVGEGLLGYKFASREEEYLPMD